MTEAPNPDELKAIFLTLVLLWVVIQLAMLVIILL